MYILEAVYQSVVSPKPFNLTKPLGLPVSRRRNGTTILFGTALNKTIRITPCLVQPIYNLWLTSRESNLSDEWQLVSLLSRSEVSQGRWQVAAVNTFCFWRNSEGHGTGLCCHPKESTMAKPGHQPELTQTQPNPLCLSFLNLPAMSWSYFCSWENTRKNNNS